MANKLFWVALISFFFCYVYMTNAASSSASESGSGSFSMSGSGSFSMTGSDSVSNSNSGSVVASVSKSKKAVPSKSKSRAAASKSKSRAAASKSKTRAAASKSKTRPAAPKGTASQTTVVLPQVVSLDNTCKTQPRVVCLKWTDPVLARGFVFNDHLITWKNTSSGEFLSAHSGVFTSYRVEELYPGKSVEFTVLGIETSSGRQGIPLAKNFTTADVNTTNPLQNDKLSISNLACTQKNGEKDFTYDVECKWNTGTSVPNSIKASLRCVPNGNSIKAKKPNLKDSNTPNGEIKWNVALKRKGQSSFAVNLRCTARVKAYYLNKNNVEKVANILTASVDIVQ